MSYSIYMKIAKASQQRAGRYIPDTNEALRTLDHFEGDKLLAALAIGRAMGIHAERQRSKPAASMLDGIMDRDADFNRRPGPSNWPYTTKPYRRVAYAVQRVYGEENDLTNAASYIENTAYKCGFAAAMRLLDECREVQQHD